MSTAVPISRSARRVTLAAAPGQTVFDFDGLDQGPLWDVADLEVARRYEGQSGWEVLDSGYSATLVDNGIGGATVTFAAPPRPSADLPAVDIRLTARRTHERETDVSRAGRLHTPSLEREADKVATVLQELRRDTDQNYTDLRQQIADVVVGQIPPNSLANDRLASMPGGAVKGRRPGAAAGEPQDLPFEFADIRMWGAIGAAGGVVDRHAFSVMAADRPSYLMIPDGEYWIDPIDIDWPCHILLMPGATLAQRTTGVTNPTPYNAVTNRVIARQELIRFLPGSEGSRLYGGGWFDGRRDDIAGFVNEYDSKWGAVGIYAENVIVEDVKAKRFHTFPFCNEMSRSTMRRLYVTDCGQGVFCGQFDAPPYLPGLGPVGCYDQVMDDIVVEHIDNKGAAVFQHAIDFMYAHRIRSRGCKIINQGGTTSGYSAYASGATVLACNGGLIQGFAHTGFTTSTIGHLAVSLIGNEFLVFSDYTIENSLDIGIEIISDYGSIIRGGRLRRGGFNVNGPLYTWRTSPGITFHTGALYSLHNRSRRTSIAPNRDTLVTENYIEGYGRGAYIRGGHIDFNGNTIVASRGNGIEIDNWSSSANFNTDAFAISERVHVANNRMEACGEAAIYAVRWRNAIIHNNIIRNGGQDVARSNTQRAALRIDPGASGQGYITVTGNDIQDTQGETYSSAWTYKPGTSDANNRYLITLLRPGLYSPGQSVTLLNGTGSGDITGTLIQQFDDEWLVQLAGPTTFSATGNTVALSGTWTTSGSDGTILNGSGGAITTELDGPFWLTDGTEWRQATSRYGAGDNTLKIDEPFSAPLAGATLSVLRVSGSSERTTTHGILAFLGNCAGCFMRGNTVLAGTVAPWSVSSLDKFMPGSEYEMWDMARPFTASPTVAFSFLPAGHALLGVAARIDTALGGSVTWGTEHQHTSGSPNYETINTGLSQAKNTKYARSPTLLFGALAVNRRIAHVATGGTPAGTITTQVRLRVECPVALADLP